jgi:PAS domain S-box-containing protein
MKYLPAEWKEIVFHNDLKDLTCRLDFAPEDLNRPNDQILKYILKNGSTVWIRCRRMIIRDDKGAPKRMLGVNANITEIKEHEERTNNLKRRLDLIFKGTSDSMAFINIQVDGVFKYDFVNNAFLQQYSLSEDKVIGKSPISIFGHNSGNRIIKLCKECIKKGEIVDFEDDFEALGLKFCLKTTMIPVEDGDMKGIIVSQKDVTETKQLKLALQLEKNNVDAIFEASTMAMLALDESTNIVSANKAAIEMCGGTSTDILYHRPGNAMNCVYSDEDPRGCGFAPSCPICPLRCGVESLLESNGGSINNAEVAVILKRDGRPQNVWLNVNAQTMVIGGKKRICVSLEDITRSKKMTKELEAYQKKLVKTNSALVKRLQQMLDALSNITEMRDAYTAGHQNRVAELAVAISSKLGLSEERILNISYGARIHDIGKVFIASEILNKPGRITELEFKLLQTHVENGYAIVKSIDFAPQIHEMILQHHERLDGTGYPRGAAGDEIILESRILAVADVVEAMNSDRPYRPALGIDVALEELQTHKGGRFDPIVVDACVELFKSGSFSFKPIEKHR